MWVIAVTIVLMLFVVDITKLTFLSFQLIYDILTARDILFYLLIPAVFMDFLTLFSYILEIFNEKNKKSLEKEDVKIKEKKLNKKEFKNYMNDIWFNPEFYEKHKDDTNLRDLRKLSKSNR